jgi:hypothetical protein
MRRDGGLSFEGALPHARHELLATASFYPQLGSE